ncbi:MAG TPA: VOC family protein [Methylococcus sp.]|nr:VOC family protein [Methylococcus sp.]
MSYLALATLRFDEVVEFYHRGLGCPVVRRWDRPDGRGCLLLLLDIRLEILDAAREKTPMRLPPPGDRFHLVLEVPDVDAARRALRTETPEPVTTSWGARMFTVRDPDGVAVCYLQWLGPEPTPEDSPVRPINP